MEFLSPPIKEADPRWIGLSEEQVPQTLLEVPDDFTTVHCGQCFQNFVIDVL